MRRWIEECGGSKGLLWALVVIVFRIFPFPLRHSFIHVSSSNCIWLDVPTLLRKVQKQWEMCFYFLNKGSLQKSIMDFCKSFSLYLNSLAEKYLYREYIKRPQVILIFLHLGDAKVRFINTRLRPGDPQGGGVGRQGRNLLPHTHKGSNYSKYN